jgi:hypothetical protein
VHVGEVEGREGGKVLKRRFRVGQIHPNRRSIDIRGALLVTVGAGYQFHDTRFVHQNLVPPCFEFWSLLYARHSRFEA